MPLVGTVGKSSCPCRKKKNRTKLAGGQHTYRDPAPGDGEHQQNEGDVGQPVARVRDHLADEKQLEIAVPEGEEGLLQGPAESCDTGIVTTIQTHRSLQAGTCFS
jgi:hypothetical protein